MPACGRSSEANTPRGGHEELQLCPISHHIKKHKYISDDALEQKKTSSYKLQQLYAILHTKCCGFEPLSILFPQACMALFSAVLPWPANDVDDPDVKAHSSA